MKWTLAGVCIAGLLVMFSPAAARADTGPIKTRLVKTDGHWQLLRNGKPYFIKGGGGGGSMDILAHSGGNSIRTWGVDGDVQQQLDQADKLGVTVTLGIWLGHKDQGFDYGNAQAVQAQFDMAKKAVLRLKNEPAALIWAVGNEMENNNDTPQMWKAVENIARMIHQVDPNHPTMTVIAEIGGGGEKVKHIQQDCPDIDIIGINSYGGGPSVGERYQKAGGAKPFVITEFGPPGTWEIPMNSFGAAPEATSTKKADFYRATYEKTVLGTPGLCLGSYAFDWGHKVEATATWFGMFLPNGDKLAAVDEMQRLWSGNAPEHPCPEITSLKLLGNDEVNGGDTIRAQVAVSDPAHDTDTIKWVLAHEQASYGVQGANADAAPMYPGAIAHNGEATVTVKLPKFGGVYRLYCYVTNSHHGAAVANVPLKATGPEEPFEAPQAKLPLVIFASGGAASAYIPSGWMGNTSAIAMDFASPDRPHSGKSCLKVEYKAKDNWGGVMWQSPANDWGEQPGGFAVTGAKTLSFWARGAHGGEQVKFGYGGLGADKKYHDSATDSSAFTLTPQWKRYTLSLSGKDLSCIKTGFSWVVAGSGSPITFYLDDIEFN